MGIHGNAVALASEADAPDEASAKYKQEEISVSAVGATAWHLIHRKPSATNMVHSEYQVPRWLFIPKHKHLAGCPKPKNLHCRRAVACTTESNCTSSESS